MHLPHLPAAVQTLTIQSAIQKSNVASTPPFLETIPYTQVRTPRIFLENFQKFGDTFETPMEIA
jgi:hypothetical protein